MPPCQKRLRQVRLANPYEPCEIPFTDTRAKSVSHDVKKSVLKLAKDWKKKGRRAEAESLRQVSFHTTRHTFASWLIQRGVPPAEIQQYLGHSSDTMTRRYAHLVRL